MWGKFKTFFLSNLNIAATDRPKLSGCPKGAIALSYPPRVRVRAMVKLSAMFFHDESSITIRGYESAIAPSEVTPDDGT